MLKLISSEEVLKTPIFRVTMDHAVAARDLPLHHRDPFDRILIAQAQLEQLIVVTSDPMFGRYDVPVLSAN